jgi:hypothetical protein
MDQQSRPAPLTIQVSFETSRISAQCLIDAYDRLVPTQHRRLCSPREPEPGEGVALINRRSDHA